MPTHRIPRAHLDEDLKELRSTGERVVAMTNDGEYVVVVTDYATEERGQ